jgi:hypothetical protein
MKKIVLASLKVFKKDFEELISEFADDMGLGKFGIAKQCDESQEALLEKVETEREKALSRVTGFFDKLKQSILDQESGNCSVKASFQDNSEAQDLLLGIKELTHKVNRLQEDINEMKGKS